MTHRLFDLDRGPGDRHRVLAETSRNGITLFGHENITHPHAPDERARRPHPTTIAAALLDTTSREWLGCSITEVPSVGP